MAKPKYNLPQDCNSKISLYVYPRVHNSRLGMEPLTKYARSIYTHLSFMHISVQPVEVHSINLLTQSVYGDSCTPPCGKMFYTNIMCYKAAVYTVYQPFSINYSPLLLLRTLRLCPSVLGTFYKYLKPLYTVSCSCQSIFLKNTIKPNMTPNMYRNNGILFLYYNRY